MENIFKAIETPIDIQGQVMADVLMDDTIPTRDMYGDLAEMYRRATFEEREIIDKTLNILIKKSLEEVADEILKTAAEEAKETAA